MPLICVDTGVSVLYRLLSQLFSETDIYLLFFTYAAIGKKIVLECI
jgi:hypothetical protein